ncbi:helix-turn-helix transcriptional regulator [Trinickia fusca]|nr:AraC family transcriptional regulator [Trinickia fusca]
MDLLSRLTAFVRVRGNLLPLCPSSKGWVEDCPQSPPGVIPYHVVVEGACDFELVATGTRTRLTTGEIVVVPHGAHHRLLPLPRQRNSVVRILCGTFATAPLRESVLLAGMPEQFVIDTQDRAEFAWLAGVLDMMENETLSERAGTAGIVGDLSSAIFTLILRTWLEAAPVAAGLLAMAAHPALERIAVALLDEPERDWTAEQLAALGHVSRATLARLTDKHGAPTPARLLTELRMHRAAQWLARGDATAARVADWVGYDSEAAFNRAFKRLFGITPGRFASAARMPR